MRYLNIIVFILFLSGCSTSQSVKQINLIDKNISHIQSEVKAVKDNINKTKQSITKIKQEQPTCNLETIETQIEFLELQTNSVDNSLSFVKRDLGNTKYIIDMEVKEYKNKYHRCIAYIIVLIILLLLVIFNRIKISISSVWGYCKNIFNWFKK